jgi:hypothetical protein
MIKTYTLPQDERERMAVEAVTLQAESDYDRRVLFHLQKVLDLQYGVSTLATLLEQIVGM